MKINLKNILTGAFNSVFVKEEIERVAKERERICEQCEWYSENAKLRGYKTVRLDSFCTDCLCNIHMKTRVLSEQCPMKKWLAEVTDEEDDKIQEMLKNENQD
jgi:hypothetical protein